MHRLVMINALICINNYVITCINRMLSKRSKNFHARGKRDVSCERGRKKEKGEGEKRLEERQRRGRGGTSLQAPPHDRIYFYCDRGK